ncbi:MAG: energy transducer TonB [Bacteroidota bacterium]|nr:energy transducer TonB [Bacteroidota bacterium]
MKFVITPLQGGGIFHSPLMLLLLLCALPAVDAVALHAQQFGERPAAFDAVQTPTDEAAELIDPLEVEYPDSALRSGMEGVALIAVWIDERGYAVYGELRESSGHALLDSLALRAVRRGNFKAARRAGKNVASRVSIPVEFRLRRDEENYDATKSGEQLQQEAEELRRAKQMLEEERLRLEEELRRLKKERDKKLQEEKK